MKYNNEYNKSQELFNIPQIIRLGKTQKLPYKTEM